MTNSTERAQRFKALHVPGRPLVLYNIWDAGGAKALAEAGAPAVGTGSWSMAAAQGFVDGQAIPLDLVLTLVKRITASAECPVSVDFEGGYATTPEAIAENVVQVMDSGAVGINFEDQVVNGPGLTTIENQSARIKAIRSTADGTDLPLFINARTDVFLKIADGSDPTSLMNEAKARLAAYANAGADGFFVPGLTDLALIEDLCRESPLPVNVMMMGELDSVAVVARCGVARASFGPGPYFKAVAELVSNHQRACVS